MLDAKFLEEINLMRPVRIDLFFALEVKRLVVVVKTVENVEGVFPDLVLLIDFDSCIFDETKELLEKWLMLAVLVTDVVASREDAVVVKHEVVEELQEFESDLSRLSLIAVLFVHVTYPLGQSLEALHLFDELDFSWEILGFEEGEQAS